MTLDEMRERGVTDAELRAVMVSPAWVYVVEAAKRGGAETVFCHDLIGRATRLYNAGAPCMNVETGTVETLDPETVKKYRAEAKRRHDETVAKAQAEQRRRNEVAKAEAATIREQIAADEAETREAIVNAEIDARVSKALDAHEVANTTAQLQAFAAMHWDHVRPKRMKHKVLRDEHGVITGTLVEEIE